MNQVILMLDDGRPRACLHSRKAVTTVGCSVLSHHPSSPNLPLSDFHLFGPLKDSLRGRCFADKDDLKRRARSALTLQRRVLRNWHAVVQKWKKCVCIMTDTLRKNNLNFVKGVPTVCANFIVIIITVSETKIQGITFVLPLARS